MREPIDEELADLFLPGMGPKLRNFFSNNGITTMAQLLAMQPRELLELPRCGRGMLLVLKPRACGPWPALTQGSPPGELDGARAPMHVRMTRPCSGH